MVPDNVLYRISQFLGQPLPGRLEAATHTRIHLRFAFFAPFDESLEPLRYLRRRLPSLKGCLHLTTRLLPEMPHTDIKAPDIILQSLRPLIEHVPKATAEPKSSRLRFCLCASCDRLREHIFEWEWRGVVFSVTVNDWIGSLLRQANGGLRQLLWMDTSSPTSMRVMRKPPASGGVPDLMRSVARQWAPQNLPRLDADTSLRARLCEEIKVTAIQFARRRKTQPANEIPRQDTELSDIMMRAFIRRAVDDVSTGFRMCLRRNAATLRTLVLKGPVFSEGKIAHSFLGHCPDYQDIDIASDCEGPNEEPVRATVTRHTIGSSPVPPSRRRPRRRARIDDSGGRWLCPKLSVIQGPMSLCHWITAPQLTSATVQVAAEQSNGVRLIRFLTRHHETLATLSLSVFVPQDDGDMAVEMYEEGYPELPQHKDKTVAHLVKLQRLSLECRLHHEAENQAVYARSTLVHPTTNVVSLLKSNEDHHALPLKNCRIEAPALQCLNARFCPNTCGLTLNGLSRHVLVTYAPKVLGSNLRRRQQRTRLRWLEMVAVNIIDMNNILNSSEGPLSKLVLWHVQSCKRLYQQHVRLAEEIRLAKCPFSFSLVHICNAIPSLKVLICPDEFLSLFLTAGAEPRNGLGSLSREGAFAFVEVLVMTGLRWQTIVEIERTAKLLKTKLPALRFLCIDLREYPMANVDAAVRACSELDGLSELWLVMSKSIIGTQTWQGLTCGRFRIRILAKGPAQLGLTHSLIWRELPRLTAKESETEPLSRMPHSNSPIAVTVHPCETTIAASSPLSVDKATSTLDSNVFVEDVQPAPGDMSGLEVAECVICELQQLALHPSHKVEGLADWIVHYITRHALHAASHTHYVHG